MPGGRRLHLFDAQCVQRLNQHHLPGHRLGDWRLYERRPYPQTDPFRVDCDDASVPHRQRATQILKDLDSPVSVDQCASGVGYVYTQRRFAVCVEDVTGGPRS